MVDQPTDVVTNTDDMVIVHRVFRREFQLLPLMVRAVPDGDTARAEMVGAHSEELMTALHHHHLGEDEELWPILEHRALPQIELIHRMHDQHEQMASLLEDCRPLLTRWRRSASAEHAEALGTALDALPTVLTEHLDDEERHILPLVRQYVTNAEWAVLGRRGMASLPKARLLVFLGYMFEDATPAERTTFMSRLPLPPRVLYRLVGQRKYEAERQALRAGL
jgi:iron-sulfur cluster repair protein YtfE (RIC family)